MIQKATSLPKIMIKGLMYLHRGISFGKIKAKSNNKGISNSMTSKYKGLIQVFPHFIFAVTQIH